MTFVPEALRVTCVPAHTVFDGEAVMVPDGLGVTMAYVRNLFVREAVEISIAYQPVIAVVAFDLLNVVPVPSKVPVPMVSLRVPPRKYHW